MQWVIQNLEVPLQVAERATILIRLPDLKPEDCLHLDREIQLVSDVSIFSPEARDGPNPRNSVSSCSTVPQPSPSPFPVQTVPKKESDLTAVSVGADSAPMSFPFHSSQKAVPFPLKYVVDMHLGLKNMKTLGKSQDWTKEKFAVYFPKSKYVKQTFNRMRNIYLRGVEAEIVGQYVTYGRTSKGLWTNFAKAVNRTLWPFFCFTYVLTFTFSSCQSSKRAAPEI